MPELATLQTGPSFVRHRLFKGGSIMIYQTVICAELLMLYDCELKFNLKLNTIH